MFFGPAGGIKLNRRVMGFSGVKLLSSRVSRDLASVTESLTEIIINPRVHESASPIMKAAEGCREPSGSFPS